MLDSRICDIMENETNDKTLREFISELELMSGITEDNIDTFTYNQIIDYIDYLWVISATIC